MTTSTSRATLPNAKYASNVYFQDGTALTAGLLVVLYLILATSLDAAGYVESMALLIPVSMGALVLGFLMSFSRFDGFFALSHSMFTGLAWILFLMTGMVNDTDIAPFVSNGIPETQARAYFVLLRWLNWVDAAINNVASNDNYVFVFEMSFLVWWLTYLGVWSILRYGYTWRAIVPAGLVLLINTYYAPNSILGFLAVFCLVGLLILVRTNLAEHQLRWREQRVYFSQDIALDFLRTGFFFSVVVLILAATAPDLGRSFQVQTVLAPLNDQWQATTERWNRLYQGLNRQTRGSSSAFGRTLSLGGARTVGDSYVFNVQAGGGRYWRAVVYDTYTGRQWVSTEGSDEVFAADEHIPVPNWQLRREVTQTVTLMAPMGNLLFSAPEMLRASVPMEALVRPVPGASSLDGGDTNAVEVSLARARRTFEVNDQYTVVSMQTEVTELALVDASIDYPQEIIDLYLQLPDDFSARVAEDATALVEGKETVYAQAKAIETFLRTITYNDAIDAPPADQDPVEYFLYDIQEGYCDYYATAMAVMLRSVGIPARVVSGYAEGTYDPDVGLFLVTERDAHTWVEVFFPEYGWVEFEPTAGETALSRPRGIDALNPDSLLDEMGGAAFPTNPDEDLYGLEEDLLLPDQLNNQFNLTDSVGVGGANRWWVWILTPVLLVAGGWFIWRTQVSGPTRFDPDLPPIFFERMQLWAQRLGIVTAQSQTPYEQAVHLGVALPEGRRPINSITESYVQYRFRQRSTTPGQDISRNGHGEPDLFLSWKELRPIVWKAWLMRIFVDRFRGRRDDFTLVRTEQNGRPGNSPFSQSDDRM